MSAVWPSVRLGEILTRSTEAAVIQPEAEYQEITIRLWGKGVIRRGIISGTQFAGQRRFVARGGQFILSRIDARHGASGLVPQSLDGALVSNDFPTFVINSNRLHPEYLVWLSRTKAFVAMCRTASEGTTNRVRLSEASFLDLRLELPPLAEQQRLGRHVCAVAAELKTRTDAVKQAGAEIDALLRSAFALITTDAPRRRMGDVAPLVRRPVTIEPDGSYPEVGIRSFGKGTFHKPALSGLEVGSKRLFRIEPNDLLFSNVFAWEGAVAVARVDDAGRFGSHRFITCVAKPDQASASFLRYYFLTPEGLQRLGDASPGGAGRNRTLALEGLAEIEVPLPDSSTQKWFDTLQAEAAKASAARAEADAVAAQLLPTLLTETFSGGITVEGGAHLP